MAIRSYWGLGSSSGSPDASDNYVLLVADDFGGKGNLLNFNVGPEVDLLLPSVFFSRVSSKYGSLFYVKDNGKDTSVINAVEDIATCLLSEEGSCTAPRKDDKSFF